MVSSVSVGMVVAGRYTLERCINRGGIGALWLARDEQSDKYCGLRLAESTGQGIVELASRYLAEVDVVGRIRCENVVDVLDYGEWNGMPFLVVEHVEGEELAATLLHKGNMQPKVAYRIIAQTARALARAHASSIVHGDLTPEHIIITSDGMQPMAKVFNFGLSQRGAEAGVTNATRIGSFLHMPYYSSPEHIANRAVDWRTDLWSLAVICHECLVGRRPFDSNNFGELLSLIVTEPIAPINLPGGRTPAALQTWWKKAVSRDPEERYQSAKEIADALGKAFGFPLVFVPEPTNTTLGPQASPAALPIVIRDSSMPPVPGAIGRAITPNPKLKSAPVPAPSKPMQVAVRARSSSPDALGSMSKFVRHSTVMGLGVASSNNPLPKSDASDVPQGVLPPQPSIPTTGSEPPGAPPSSLKVDVDVVPPSAASPAEADRLAYEGADSDNEEDSFAAFPASEAPTVARKPVLAPQEQVHTAIAYSEPRLVSSIPPKPKHRAAWFIAAAIVIVGAVAAARLLNNDERPSANTNAGLKSAQPVLPAPSGIQAAVGQEQDAGLANVAVRNSAESNPAAASQTEAVLPSDSEPHAHGVPEAPDSKTAERSKEARGKTGGVRRAVAPVTPRIPAKPAANTETVPPAAAAAPGDADPNRAPSKPATKPKPAAPVDQYGI